MVANKNQHVVPVSYLQAWTDPNRPPRHDPFVHIFDKKGNNHKKRAPANILNMPEIYTIFTDGERDTTIEQHFSRQEKEFARVRRLIEQDGRLDQAQDLAALYAFVAGMLARPPHKIDHFTKQWAAIASMANTIKPNPNIPPISGLSSPGEPCLTIDEVQRMADDPMGTWFGGSLNSYIEALTEFFGFEVLVNRSPYPFMTSDNPAVVYFTDDGSSASPNRKLWPKGLGARDCEITMPISPTHALKFTRKPPCVPDWMVLDWEAVFEINFLTITRARQTIISDREDLFFVRAILDRVAAVESLRPVNAE